MSNHTESVDSALARFRQAGLRADGWAYLAAEAVRGLNHRTIHTGSYAYPADVYAVIAQLQTLLQRLPQALHQAARALEGMDDAGHVLDVTDPGHTAVSVIEVTYSLARAVALADTAARELATAQIAAARLANQETGETAPEVGDPR